jgi:hypothetical protein
MKQLNKLLSINSIQYRFNLRDLLLSIYAGLGCATFILLHANASHYLILLERDTFIFSFVDAIYLSILWGIFLFGLIFIFFILIKNNTILKILNPLTIIVIGLFAFSMIQGGRNAFTIIYLFILSVIFGISYHISEGNLKPLIQSKKSLELEHKEILQYVQFINWGIIIIILSALIGTLSPDLSKDLSSEGVGLEIIGHTILVIYFILGIWFGVVVQLIQRMEIIRNEIFEIDKSQNNEM